MPNHCHNRVTFYSSGNDTDESRKQIEDIRAIFDEESIFTQIIPEPDWHETPLMSSDMPKYDWDTPLGKVGELPQYVEDPRRRLVFKSTNKSDDRWYDWRVQNWDTKWDAYDVEFVDVTLTSSRLHSIQHGRHQKLYALHSENSILTCPSRGSTTSRAVR